MNNCIQSDQPSDTGGLFLRAQSGDEIAWTELFHACYPKVRRVLEKKLAKQRRSADFDASDLASDLFKSLAAKQDRYEFADVDSVIRFLVKAGEDRLIDCVRKGYTLKRDIRRERPLDGPADRPAEDWLASPEPTPSQCAVAREVKEQLLAGQSDEALRAIVMRLDGHTPQEITGETGWHKRKAQRFFQSLAETFSGRGVQ